MKSVLCVLNMYRLFNEFVYGKIFRASVCVRLVCSSQAAPYQMKVVYDLDLMTCK